MSKRLLYKYTNRWHFSQLVLSVLIGQMFQLFSLDTKIIKYAPYLASTLAFGGLELTAQNCSTELESDAVGLNSRIYGHLVMVAFFIDDQKINEP